jgi:hypothetical protein
MTHKSLDNFESRSGKLWREWSLNQPGAGIIMGKATAQVVQAL